MTEQEEKRFRQAAMATLEVGTLVADGISITEPWKQLPEELKTALNKADRLTRIALGYIEPDEEIQELLKVVHEELPVHWRRPSYRHRVKKCKSLTDKEKQKLEERYTHDE